MEIKRKKWEEYFKKLLEGVEEKVVRERKEKKGGK